MDKYASGGNVADRRDVACPTGDERAGPHGDAGPHRRQARPGKPLNILMR